MREVTDHRLRAGEAGAAGEVGRVAIAEQVGVRSVVSLIAPAAADAVVLVEVVIAFDGDLVRFAGIDALVEPVVGVGEGRALLVGSGQETECLHGQRVHARGGDHVSGKWLARDHASGIRDGVERIVDLHQLARGVEGLREVTAALLGRRQAGLLAGRALLRRILVSAEEEGFVLDHRPAEHAAVLIAVKRRNGAARAVGKPVVGVQRRVAHEVVARAVQIVGARTGHHVHNRPARLPVLSREEVGLHLKLLHRIHRRRELQVGDTRVLLNSGHRRSVNQHVRSGVARAVGAEVRIAVAAPPTRTHDARRQVGQAHRVAGQIGQLQNVLVVDHLTEVRNGGIHQRGRTLDFHGRRHIAHLQLRRNRALLLHGDAEAATLKLLESRRFHDERVIARGQRGNDESAGAVGYRAKRGAAVAVGDEHFGRPHYRSGFIGNNAVHASGERLSKQA